MSAKKQSRTFSASLENLERRETPSAITAGHLADAHVRAEATKTVALTSRANLLSQGFGVVAQSAPGVNGHEVTSAFFGNSKALGGHYTALIDVFYGLGKDPVGTGSGTITTASGDEIDLEVKSRSLIPYFSTNPSGKLEFNIVDGTGAYADSTGRGTFVGYLNYVNSFRFELRGHIDS